MTDQQQTESRPPRRGLRGRLRVGVGSTVDRESVVVYVVRVDDDGDWLGSETMLSLRPIAERTHAVEYAERIADSLDAEFHDEQS